MYEKGEQNIKNDHPGQQRMRRPSDPPFPQEVYPPVTRDDAVMIAMLKDIQNRLSRLEAAILPHPGSAAR